MGLAEQGIAWLQTLPPSGVLLLVFAVAYIENIVPPSPSDVLLVFAGTLTGIGTVGFIPALAAATAGSVTGFLSAYLIGRYFEPSMTTGRLSRWLPSEALGTAETLFRKYGYGVIVANRFLAGTRAIISFFAGVSRMNLPVTTALCAMSALAWNAILLSLGKLFGSNWRAGVGYLELYGKAVTALVAVAAVIGVYLYMRRHRVERARPDR
jgi:membrane protein DedA with SNARE-associated domain